MYDPPPPLGIAEDPFLQVEEKRNPFLRVGEDSNPFLGVEEDNQTRERQRAACLEL